MEPINPVISTYSVTGYQTLTESLEYPTVDDLLLQIPDNNENIIRASDLRDAVYTLWNRIDDSGSGSTCYYTNTEPTTATNLEGFEPGTTNLVSRSMQEMWDQLLYPYVKFTISLSVANSPKEYGDPEGLEPNSVALNWSVSKESEPITSIMISSGSPNFSESLVVDGGDQNGVYRTNGTHSWTTTALSSTNVYTLTVKDNKNITVVKNSTLTWMNRVYWGKIDLNTMLGGNVDLTSMVIGSVATPDLVEQVSNKITNDLILDLANDGGASVTPGSQLRTNKNRSYDGIDGAGEHLLFAWPSGMTNGDPTFTIGGFDSSAYTKVKDNWSFINDYGYTANYDVFVLDTAQNGFIKTFTIS